VLARSLSALPSAVLSRLEVASVSNLLQLSSAPCGSPLGLPFERPETQWAMPARHSEMMSGGKVRGTRRGFLMTRCRSSIRKGCELQAAGVSRVHELGQQQSMALHTKSLKVHDAKS
jgi:hypothetical protein